jgi:tRNA1(Val) A37 N6-methylase TrmN6
MAQETRSYGNEQGERRLCSPRHMLLLHFNFNSIETRQSSADFQTWVLMIVLYHDILEVNKYHSKGHFSSMVALNPPYNEVKHGI